MIGETNAAAENKETKKKRKKKRKLDTGCTGYWKLEMKEVLRPDKNSVVS